MIDNLHPTHLVTKFSEAAAVASGRCPRPLRAVVDRTLVDFACLASGGPTQLADDLQVDVPAVEAWRTLGVPDEFRARLHATAVWPPRAPLSRRTPANRLPIAA